MWKKIKESRLNWFRKRSYSEIGHDEQHILNTGDSEGQSSKWESSISTGSDYIPDTHGNLVPRTDCADFGVDGSKMEFLTPDYEFYAARSNGLSVPITVRETVEQFVKSRWQRRYRKLDNDDDDDLENSDQEKDGDNKKLNDKQSTHRIKEEETNDACYSSYEQSHDSIQNTGVIFRAENDSKSIKISGKCTRKKKSRRTKVHLIQYLRNVSCFSAGMQYNRSNM